MDMTLHESKQLLHFPYILICCKIPAIWGRFWWHLASWLSSTVGSQSRKATVRCIDDATPCGVSKRKICAMKCLVLERFQVVTCGEFVVWAQASGSDDLRGFPSLMKKWGSINEWFHEKNEPHLEVSSSKTWRCPRSDLFCFLSKLWVVDIQQLNKKNGWFFDKFMRIHWAPLATVTFKVPVGYCYGDLVIDSFWLNESSF